MRARRRDSTRGGATADCEGTRSSRYRNLKNPFVPTRVFSDNQVESLHQMALGLLENQGMRVLSPRGRAAFAAAGAQVDESTNMVRLDRGLVAQALTTVPAEVDLIARSPYRNSRDGGPHEVFAPVAGPPNVHETDGKKHSGSLADYHDFVKLSQAYDVIHVLGQMVEPVDAPI